ncbi:unnamed protein product [Nesidiocoris tenuis]|uniref:Uncharacterized protein n=1 Tax=Nesidiocoris tenuis TaxID=355587 RepID=A0A6H5H7E2_9HEMI|nr:unnamed protein product [Nesidiocoris tenuis]
MNRPFQGELLPIHVQQLVHLTEEQRAQKSDERLTQSTGRLSIRSWYGTMTVPEGPLIAGRPTQIARLPGPSTPPPRLQEDDVEMYVVDPSEMPSAPVSAKLIPREEEIIRRRVLVSRGTPRGCFGADCFCRILGYLCTSTELNSIRRLFRALRRGIRELLGEMSASRRRSVCDRLLSIMDQLELLLMGPNQLPQRAP